jgi:hypothetical protein
MVAAVSSAPGNRMAGVGAFADGDYRTPFIVEAETNGLFLRRYSSRLRVHRSGSAKSPRAGCSVTRDAKTASNAAVNFASRSRTR